jgi:hypothetical protein
VARSLIGRTMTTLPVTTLPVTTLLVSTPFEREFGADLRAFARACGIALELVLLPEDVDARVGAEDTARIDAALFSGDIHPAGSRSFYSTLRKAAGLKWLHVFNAGVDAPIFTELMQRGVRLSTSSGTNAEAVANSALAGLLALSRGLPGWMQLQRERRWRKRTRAEAPPDLRGQTMLLLGAGAIGGHIAAVARAIGLHVVAVRRSAARDGDPAHETHPPSALAALLPRADWLVIACPLTPQTRGLAARRRAPDQHRPWRGRGPTGDDRCACVRTPRGCLPRRLRSGAAAAGVAAVGHAQCDPVVARCSQRRRQRPPGVRTVPGQSRSLAGGRRAGQRSARLRVPAT